MHRVLFSEPAEPFILASHLVRLPENVQWITERFGAYVRPIGIMSASADTLGDIADQVQQQIEHAYDMDAHITMFPRERA